MVYPPLAAPKTTRVWGFRLLGLKVQDDLSVYAVEKGPGIELFTDIQTGQL